MTTKQEHDEKVERYLADKAARVAEIRRSIEILHAGHEIVEVTSPKTPGRGKPHVAAGYYRDHDKAAEDAFLLCTNHTPTGVYTRVNEIKPALYNRSPDQITHYQETLTGDHEIAHRWHLFIDCDSSHPTGVPANEAEHQAAMDLAYETETFLRSHGFGDPLTGSSGNGYMLLYRIDLANTPESRDLAQAILHTLNAKVGQQFVNPNEPHAKFDLKVYNAARLMRLSGTWNRLGHSTSDRPHRLAEWGELPGDWRIVATEYLEAVAAMAPQKNGQQSSARQPKQRGGVSLSRMLVDRYLADHGIRFKTKQIATGIYYILDECPFNPQHGKGGEVAIAQNQNGLVTFDCKHDSCEGRRWADFRDAVGAPDPERHYDPPLSKKRQSPQVNVEQSQVSAIAAGTIVKAGDRGNYGTVLADNGDTCTVHFRSPDGQEAMKELPKSSLRTQDGSPLDPSAGVDIGPPIPLGTIIQANPKLRPPVIDGLLRRGETMNIIAAPKQGKSWLAAGLALAVADGFDWLDTFACHQSRVLIIDAELHPETIAHRLPMAAEAAGASADYADRIDVWAVRGKGVDLLGLGPAIAEIPPDQYSLVILDAWYRFLPPGISENDNAAVMALYNTIDGYSGRLNAAWVNVHHASKGDQSSKGTTDVGSGAGAQSRAADSHMIIRPHETDGVAVVDAVVRSWPAVDSFAIRWDFPAWFLDRLSDPKKLRRPGNERQAANDAEGKAVIVSALEEHGHGTASDLRKWTGIRHGRMQRLLHQLADGGQVTYREITRRGNTCEDYSLAPC